MWHGMIKDVAALMKITVDHSTDLLQTSFEDYHPATSPHSSFEMHGQLCFCTLEL